MKRIFLISMVVMALAAPAYGQTFLNHTFEVSNPVCTGNLNLIDSGSGELTDWIVGGGTDIVSIICGAWDGSEGSGSQSLHLHELGSIDQDITTQAGCSYTVGFELSARPGGPTDKTLDVSADGVQTASYSTQNDATNNEWTHEIFQFVASDTSTTIEFLSTTTSGRIGPVVDDVHVESETCPLTIIKEDVHDSGTTFNFDSTNSLIGPFALSDDGINPNSIELAPNDRPVNNPMTFDITETLPAGWVLDSIDCNDTNNRALIFTPDVPNGTVTISNWYFGREEADCTFTNSQYPPPPVPAVPTMTQWGMVIFVIMSGAGALLYLRRRKASA